MVCKSKMERERERRGTLVCEIVYIISGERRGLIKNLFYYKCVCVENYPAVDERFCLIVAMRMMCELKAIHQFIVPMITRIHTQNVLPPSIIPLSSLKRIAWYLPPGKSHL